jgi:hypothetical protein
MKQFLKDLLYSRRTVDGKLYRGQPVTADFVNEETEELIEEVNLRVESSDIDANSKEVCLSVYFKDTDLICSIYLKPDQAKELACVLFDPLRS